MDRFLVHQIDNTPGTHAIVIGVGDYPHLVGGTGQRSEAHDGMGQLTSPPVSGRSMADWLLQELSHPDHQELALSSLALLLSDPDSDEYENPVDQTIHKIELPTFENVKAAIKQWKARGDDDEANFLLFYFCGHGISRGTETTLLLRDYGADDDNPLDGAIDFSQMRLGMRKCNAEKQIYFVDVCRTDSDTLHSAFGFGGHPIILPDITVASSVKSPTYYSTLQGHKAFGRTNQPSVFTEFLLKSLRGAAADNTDDGDQWWVSDARLQIALSNYLSRAALAGEIIAQVSEADGVADFAFHRLKHEPVTDVYVSCRPPAAHSQAKLFCKSESDVLVASRDTPSSDSWDLSLPVGKFIFSAEVPGKPMATKPRDIRPPFRKVPIDVD